MSHQNDRFDFSFYFLYWFNLFLRCFSKMTWILSLFIISSFHFINCFEHMDTAWTLEGGRQIVNFSYRLIFDILITKFLLQINIFSHFSPILNRKSQNLCIKVFWFECIITCIIRGYFKCKFKTKYGLKYDFCEASYITIYSLNQGVSNDSLMAKFSCATTIKLKQQTEKTVDSGCIGAIK